MKPQQRRGPDAHRGLRDATGAEKKRPEGQEKSVNGREVRRPSSRTADNQQLLLEEEILSEHRLDTARSKKLGGDSQQVGQEQQDILHTGEDYAT